jgi:E3 ubiquitin-protein ligase BRE1
MLSREKIGEEIYGSALSFENSELFSRHLSERSDNIRAAITDLYSRIPSNSPEVESLRRQLNECLAAQKEQAVLLRRSLDEQDSLKEKWEAAVARYMAAERKLDRAKSQQVAKLEQQALMGSTGDSASPTTSKKATTPVKAEHSEANGELSNGIGSAEAEAARKEALVVAERQRAQVEEIEAENDRLTNELSAARTKLASLTDDDYAETSLFKTMKSKYEDVASHINDLEATNLQLRQEVQKFASERMNYRRVLDDESRDSLNESEAQTARAETDLARIRNVRDEMSAELEIRKRAEEVRRTSADQARGLAEARDSKISALESEVERMRLKLGEASPAANADLDELDNESLKSKFRNLESQHNLLSNELASMEAAWKKTSALASQKNGEVAAQEEQVSRLQAEKAKADQKYFAAMKAKDLKEQEVRTLRSQNSRSSEIVTQLKDAEGKTRELVTNLERQIAESREALIKLETQHRTLEQKAKETGLATEGLKKQVEEFKALVASKDKEILATGKAKREIEVELERVQTRLEDHRKQVEVLRKKSAQDNEATSDEWRVRASPSTYYWTLLTMS